MWLLLFLFISQIDSSGPYIKCLTRDTNNETVKTASLEYIFHMQIPDGANCTFSFPRNISSVSQTYPEVGSMNFSGSSLIIQPTLCIVRGWSMLCRGLLNYTVYLFQ
jgi:hypothetical protein